MVSVEDYGVFETAWCPGCGNFPLIKSLKAALAGLDLAPHQITVISGIGQAAKAPHYYKCNLLNGLHGRSLPVAQGAKLANHKQPVIVESGDGCHYAEGGNHFIAAIRRNVDLTMLAHDNQIYGLTKGQASPTTIQGQKTKAQPLGTFSGAFNPTAVAGTMKASVVARGFVGEGEHLTKIIMEAIRHPGFALVDIYQPCVTFNKVNTYDWYKERCYILGEDHDPTDWNAAMAKAMEYGERIPIGVIYKNDRISLDRQVPQIKDEPLCRQSANLDALHEIMMEYA